MRGAWNMAVDEAILESVGKLKSPPTLRFFAWEPPCLSLGYAQPIGDVDQPAIAAFGWDLVRRPTGGRAILHTDELTYSVIGPETDPRLAGGVLESYHNLSHALLYGLHLLGIPAESVEKPPVVASAAGPVQVTGQARLPSQNPVCFEVPSNYEITLGGKKLIGSAQARRKDGVLQHGSLPLHGDLTRIIWALRFPDDAVRQRAAGRLLERATTVQAALGELIAWQTAVDAFAQGFCETLNLELQPGELSPAESARAAELVTEKYAHQSWTERV
jgi:lipoate-protein ligase A